LLNISTLIGVIIGTAVLIFAVLITSDNPLAYANATGVVIVLGGILASTFVAFPLAKLKKIPRLIFIIFNDQNLDSDKEIKELSDIAKLWFQGDIREVEQRLEKSKDPFLKSGIQLVIDQSPLEDILELMNWRIQRLKISEQADANIFRAMGSFAPAFGMAGTLVGLINMMQIMGDRDFTEIGMNMSIALVTTLYGLLLSNLVFKPIALKLERRTEHRVMFMSMVLEGVSLIQQKRSPSFVNETLKSFTAHYTDELHQYGQPE